MSSEAVLPAARTWAISGRQKLVFGGLALALAMIVALYFTLTSSMSRVERKLAQDADLAKWSRFCGTLRKPQDRQQCLDEVQTRRLNAAASAAD